ncbi:hypothetical protein [Prosthecobacter sp.]|uniref:hypothetical protein n=1 Tax=Prosthecobacter sp. TaxID=1965333 RepID=UPI003784EADC
MNFFYCWVDYHLMPPRHMAFAFYTARTNRALFVLFPFHYLIALAWWIQDKWAKAALAPSWIDQEVEHRMKLYDALNR